MNFKSLPKGLRTLLSTYRGKELEKLASVHLHNVGLQFPHITRGHAVNPSARAAAAAAAADGAHETQKPNHHMFSAG